MFRKIYPIVLVLMLLAGAIPAHAASKPIWLHALCGGVYEVDTRGYGVEGFFSLEILYVRSGKTHLDKIEMPPSGYVSVPNVTQITASIDGRNETILKVLAGPSCPPYEPMQFDNCRYTWDGSTMLYWKVVRNTNPFPVNVMSFRTNGAVTGGMMGVAPLFSRYWGFNETSASGGIRIESLDGKTLQTEKYITEWRVCDPAELY